VLTEVVISMRMVWFEAKGRAIALDGLVEIADLEDREREAERDRERQRGRERETERDREGETERETE
jgi:hypothetical protein